MWGTLLNIVFLKYQISIFPLIMGVLGVGLNIWVNSFAFTPEILLGGLASGLASTGAFEAIRNLKAKKELE